MLKNNIPYNFSLSIKFINFWMFISLTLFTKILFTRQRKICLTKIVQQRLHVCCSKDELNHNYHQSIKKIYRSRVGTKSTLIKVEAFCGVSLEIDEIFTISIRKTTAPVKIHTRN